MSRVLTEVIGDATLILGDCREFLPIVPAVQAVVTSPPYGAIRDYGGHPAPDLYAVISGLSRSLVRGGVIMWNVADQVIDGSESGESFRQTLYAMECGLRLHDTMIYCKNGVSFPDSNRYHPCFEYMFIWSLGAPKHFNGIRDMVNRWRGTTAHGTGRLPSGDTFGRESIGFKASEIPENGLRRNWWVISNNSREENAHPAKMPYSMAFDHIATWTIEGETVLDPFMGSGTTGVAALDQGRKFIGVEIEQKYFDAACRRVERAHEQPSLFAEKA